jgi:uncharacterized protein (DUF488 family)
VEVYTLGFTQKSADTFFGLLRAHGVRRLVDVRLNNSSQLAGFTKQQDLAYFLRELCQIDYIHEPLLAPTKELLDAYKKQHGAWDEYAARFLDLMDARRIEDHFGRDFFREPTVLLCSEPTAECCHRRLVLEYLQDRCGGLDIVHL